MIFLFCYRTVSSNQAYIEFFTIFNNRNRVFTSVDIRKVAQSFFSTEKSFKDFLKSKNTKKKNLPDRLSSFKDLTIY